MIFDIEKAEVFLTRPTNEYKGQQSTRAIM